MKSWHTRLEHALKVRGKDWADLVKVTGLKMPSVYAWKPDAKKQTKMMDGDNAAVVCEFLRINSAWLFDGKLPSGLEDADQTTKALTPVARSVEHNIAPDGYVRLEHLSPEPSMGSGAVLDGQIQIVQYLDVLEKWLRQKVGSANPERIKVLTGSGHSMKPTIQDQDLVFVDIGQHTIDLPGIYVLDVHGRFLLKKAMILGDGTLILRSDNTEEYPDEERHDLRKAADTITVAGKVLAWWTLRQ